LVSPRRIHRQGDSSSTLARKGDRTVTNKNAPSGRDAVSFLQSRTGSAPQGIGKHVLRKEDARLVVGHGSYSDDVNLPGQTHACFVRSPHAHARIGRIETAAARAIPGVIAVLTGVDAAADGVKPVAHSPMPGNPYEEIIRQEDVRFIAPHPPMPADRVRFVGEIVAMVIADTHAAARDGAEHVMIEWSALPAVTMSVAAAADNAPLLYDDVASNVCVDVKAGDAAETDHAFAGAGHVVRLQTWVHRVTGVPMEPRTALATWDPTSGRCTIHVQAGGLGRTQVGVAGALGVPESAVRATAGDVGGNFGTRNSCYPESVLVAWAARRLGCPVKWSADRREAFLADYHGRDLAVQAELALAPDGRFLALRSSNTSNLGAHAVHFGPLNKGMAIATTVYDVPVVSLHGRAVVTNTSPTTPYRSSRRPEVMFGSGGLVDLAAGRPGFGPPRPRSPEPRARRRHAVPECRRRRLRQRRLSGGLRSRRRARRLGRVREASCRGSDTRALSWDRRRELSRAQHRLSARAGACQRAAGRTGGFGARDALGGAGARDELRAAPRRVARRRARTGPTHHR